jgi:hypothetical protein
MPVAATNLPLAMSSRQSSWKRVYFMCPWLTVDTPWLTHEEILLAVIRLYSFVCAYPALPAASAHSRVEHSNS